MGMPDARWVQISPDDRAELKRLNAAVTDAADARRKWLDAKMTEYAPLKIGDEIWNVETGVRLGIVSRIYRYHGGSSADFQYDTSLTWDYEYETSPKSFDNTSRQYIRVGTRADAAAFAMERAVKLADKRKETE